MTGLDLRGNLWGGAEISILRTEMPIWIWCLFDRIDIFRVEIDARTALWVWASTHPSFCKGAEIYPIVFPPFPLCSNPPIWPSARRWKPAAVFTLLKGDWTDQSQRALVVTDTGSSPKSLFFYYIWTVYRAVDSFLISSRKSILSCFELLIRLVIFEK